MTQNRRQPLPLEDKGSADNQVRISGRLLGKGAIRYTPAGVPVVEFSLGHASSQNEAAEQRKVECEVPCVLLGAKASLLNTMTLGNSVTVAGFLAAKSLKNRTLVLHVIEIEFIEGNENGIQTEERSE